jgi:anti-anti-sigma factor
MQARVAREGEIVVIHLEGRVDVETAEPFRKACLGQLLGSKVVFDFRSLSFVGSSGILPFLETMQEFSNRNSVGFKFSGVGTEFKKVFAATTLNVIEIFDTHQQAVDSFLSPQPRILQSIETLHAMPVQAVPMNTDGAGATSPGEAPRANFGLLSLNRDPIQDLHPSEKEKLSQTRSADHLYDESD